MAPGSFECLLQTRGSDHIKQQEEEEIKSCILIALPSLSDSFTVSSL